MKSRKCAVCLMMAVMIMAGANAVIVSMGNAVGVNYDELQAAHYGSWPQTLNGFDHASSGNLSAFEIIVDMGEVESVAAILFQNMPDNGYGIGEPGDIRVYVAADESNGLTSSFTQEVTNGRTPMDADYRGIANAWETFTLPTTLTKRYVKIDITGNGQPGQTLYQWQDIAATYVVPEPATLLLLGLGAAVLRRRV